MSLNPTNFIEISKLTQTGFILFGSGNIAEKTIRKLKHSSIECIVDNSISLQGNTFKGFDIKSPEVVDYSNKMVLICSTAINDISKQLKTYGLKENINFAISPVLNDLLAVISLEELCSTFYFTSGTAASGSMNYGGGLYQCKVEGASVSLDRIYSGPCYGLLRANDSLYFVDTDKGVHAFDGDKINFIRELPNGGRAHGISHNIENSCYYINCSYRDSVIEYDSNFNLKREFHLSGKFNSKREPFHHCNDNFTIGNSLFVTMFSSTGNWKIDNFDGCIAEIDLTTGDRLDDVFSGLYMPHNVKIFNGSLHVLDSLPGHLRYGNLSIQSTFPAFTRGLALSEGIYYVGQSKNRNYSRVLGISNNISIDCGIVAFDPNMKISRFLQFPHEVGEVHSVEF